MTINLTLPRHDDARNSISAAPVRSSDADVSPGPRVTIVTGSYGAGHDRAADAVAQSLRSEAGAQTRIVDIVDVMSAGLGRTLRALYYTQLRLVPDSWEATLERLEPGGRWHRAAVAAITAASASLAQRVAGSDLVVSTHPFASQALGAARSHGRVQAPVATYLTDPSVHALWVHPGVDLHLALYRRAAAEATAWGARGVHQVSACDDAVWARATKTVPAPVQQPDAGSLLERDPLAGTGGTFVPPGRRVLVAGGSLGLGDLERTVEDLLASGLPLTPVVLCGSNEELQRRLAKKANVIALGWRTDVPALMRWSRCVVNNGGGFTTIEALTLGVPLVTYRPLPGHGRANAINLDADGLASYAQDLGGLATAMREAPAHTWRDVAPSDDDARPSVSRVLREVLGELTPVQL